MIMRPLALMFVALLAAAMLPALAHAGVANRGPAPDGAARMGPLCREDPPTRRVWGTARAGAPGGVAGATGWARPPAAVVEIGRAAEAARRRATAMGFPAVRGDAPPPVFRDPRYTRRLLAAGADERTRSLRMLSATTRGRYLAGLTAAQRTRMFRGMPAAAQRRFAADLRAGQAGRPADFIGGDRRVDIVVDGAGATRMVAQGQPGVAVCRTRQRGRTREFVGSWMVVMARPGSDSYVATTVHELMHVIQCNMGVGDAPLLVKEGTAEWLSALLSPATFPGSSPVENEIRDGNARAASFCNGFDPAGSGLQPYASWPVWEALDAGAPRSTTVRNLLTTYRTVASESPVAVLRRVGHERWSQALRTAAAAVCGTGRSPSGAVTFSSSVRSFLGRPDTSAQVGAPGTDVVPAGGVITMGAIWGRSPVAAVSVRVTAGGVSPQALAASLVVTTTGGPLTPVARDGAVFVDIPADRFDDAYVPVTIANPSASSATQVTVEVMATPAV